MRVGSMFAGIGGICLGFRQTGATIVWANEIDRYACATCRHNFPDTVLVEGDIRAVNPIAIPDIDVLTAGFPCQSFSVMGNQKGFADPRGTMYFEILRVIDANFMLQLNLLYTAITRAINKVIIVGQKEAFFRAIHKADVAKRNTVLGQLIAS